MAAEGGSRKAACEPGDAPGYDAVGIGIEPAYCGYARRAAAALELKGVEFVSSDARVSDRLRVLGSSRVIRIASYGPSSKEIAAEKWLKPEGPTRGEGSGSGDYWLRIFRS